VPARKEPQGHGAPSGDNLSFPFDDDWSAETVASPASEEQFSLKVETPEEARVEEDKRSEVAAVTGEPEEEEEDDQAEQEPGRPVSLRPVFVFLILVVTGYAVLARTLYANPEWSNEIVRALPMVGSGSQDRLLNRNVHLVNVDGRYETVKDGKDIFVISGQAVNQGSVPLGTVQVLARLLDEQDRVIDEQVIFCGNSIPLSLLRDLSAREVAIIPRLKPSSRFLIEPGEKSPFVVVFADPPRSVASFTAQVVAARRQV
jgi:hypothetical protein